MFKLDLEKAEEPEIKLPTSAGSSKKQDSSRKTSTFAHECQWWPATGLGVLSAAVPKRDLLKEVAIIFITFTIVWPQVRRRNGNPLQRSCLENPRDGGAWWAAVSGVSQSWTRLKRLSSSSSSSMVEVMKVMATSFKRSHAHTAALSAPNPAAGHRRLTPPPDSWTLPGKSGSVSCGVSAPFSWILVHTRFCLCPPRVCFPSPV